MSERGEWNFYLLTPRKGTAARAKWADFPPAAPNAGVWATEWIGRIPMDTLIFVMQLTSLSVISFPVYHNPWDLSSRKREVFAPITAGPAEFFRKPCIPGGYGI